MNQRFDVLAFGAHPDDMEVSMGGTLAKLSDKGLTTLVIDLCDGEPTRHASRGARKYTNDRFLNHLMLAASELYPEIPVALHQDHGNSPATCKSAIAMGFTSVMMDGSLLDAG